MSTFCLLKYSVAHDDCFFCFRKVILGKSALLLILFPFIRVLFLSLNENL